MFCYWLSSTHETHLYDDDIISHVVSPMTPISLLLFYHSFTISWSSHTHTRAVTRDRANSCIYCPLGFLCFDPSFSCIYCPLGLYYSGSSFFLCGGEGLSFQDSCRSPQFFTSYMCTSISSALSCGFISFALEVVCTFCGVHIPHVL